KPLGPLVRTVRLWALERGGTTGGRRRAGMALAGALLAAVLFVPIPDWRAFDATLEPARVVALTAPEELRLADASFHAGDAVGAGDVVAVLNADSLPAARSSAEAS